MKDRISKLRNLMQENKIDAWFLINSDAHNSEYLSEYDKQIKYLSGFSGSFAMLLITKEEAKLWTDGRYFVQAEKELKDSLVELMKMGEPFIESVEEYLLNRKDKIKVLGFNSKLLSISKVETLKNSLKDIKIFDEKDLVEDIWEDREKRSANEIFILENKYAGESIDKKIERVRKEIAKKDASSYICTSLSDIAWLFNLRGSDIECNPQFLSYVYISLNKVVLFVQEKALNITVKTYLKENNIEVKAYDEYYDFISELENECILVDDVDCNYKTYSLTHKNNELKYIVSIIALFKVVKNEIEVENMKKSHLRDAVYMLKYVKWLKEEVKKREISEIEASDYLESLRAKDDKFLSLSFDSISAYEKNAAMPHYKATESSHAYLKNEGLYLIDSGATYLDGTTDITRTFALGKVDCARKKHYTLALVSMLRLMNMRFPRGTTGQNLDVLARYALWEEGIDFNHGTGHGVGFCNGVHEGPISIRKQVPIDLRRNLELKEGMVLSDEPGVYIEGSHGIRCENLLVVVKDDKYEGFLKFESLTKVPFDASILDKNYMSKKDIDYFNAYQKEVFESLKDKLNEEEISWLKNEVKEI